jgi:mono/diheme cytochrome c family protein
MILKPDGRKLAPKAGAFLAVAIVFAAHAVPAADADSGKLLAQQRCGPCHILVPNQRLEVADAPPFETIARKNKLDVEAIAAAIHDPHPRMNITLTRREAEDLAAYAVSVAK